MKKMLSPPPPPPNETDSHLSLSGHLDQILFGCKLIYPELKIIPKFQTTVEIWTSDSDNETKIVNCFELIKSLKNSPLTFHLENVVFAKETQDTIIFTTKLLSYMKCDSGFENFHLMCRHITIKEGRNENMKNLLIKWLNDKSKEPGHSYCKILVSLIIEKYAFIKIKKILEFYDYFHQDALLRQLKKAYEHFISQGSFLQFLNLIFQATGKNLFNQIKVVLENHKTFPLHEFFSKEQILSQLWIKKCLEELKLSFETALVLSEGPGILSAILLKDKSLKGIVSVDKSPDFESVAIRLNHKNHSKGRFNAITKDIFDLNYKRLNLVVNKFSYTGIGRFFFKTNNVDIIINTSCEHIKNFAKWYELLPKGQLLLLQFNDFFPLEGHTNDNDADSLESFKAMAPMKNLLFAGELPSENHAHLMLIGYK